MLSSTPAARDLKFCDQTKSSSASICDNLAEGFGRYTHREFAQFVSIARGSCTETQNHLLDARDRQYVQGIAFEKAWQLSVETLAAVTALYTYLTSHPRPCRPERSRSR